MSWTAPRTWVAGETLTAALLNAHLRDNLDAAFPVGSLHWRMQAATTSETTIDGLLLEANAVSVLRATYAALNTKLSGLSYPFGTVDGTHMTLPDLQGRNAVPMVSGGHADVNALGDSDGVTKNDRTPKHNSTNSLSVSAGSLAVSQTVFTPAAGTTLVSNTTSNVAVVNSLPQVVPTITGSPSLSGTIGPGGTRPIDTVPYLVVGVLGVKY